MNADLGHRRTRSRNEATADNLLAPVDDRRLPRSHSTLRLLEVYVETVIGGRNARARRYVSVPNADLGVECA